MRTAKPESFIHYVWLVIPFREIEIDGHKGGVPIEKIYTDLKALCREKHRRSTSSKFLRPFSRKRATKFSEPSIIKMRFAMTVLKILGEIANVWREEKRDENGNLLIPEGLVWYRTGKHLP